MRHRISRQRKDIQSLHSAGISMSAPEALLARMQATVDNVRLSRNKRVGEHRMKYPGTNKAIKGPDAIAVDRGVSSELSVRSLTLPLRDEFLVQPVSAVVTPPNLSAHKPAGNCSSRNDDRM
jgi:hypothetical protein